MLLVAPADEYIGIRLIENSRERLPGSQLAERTGQPGGRVRQPLVVIGDEPRDGGIAEERLKVHRQPCRARSALRLNRGHTSCRGLTIWHFGSGSCGRGDLVRLSPAEPDFAP